MKYDKMLMLLTLVAAGLAAGCSDDEDPLKDWTGPSKPGTEIKTPAEVGNRVVAHRGGGSIRSPNCVPPGRWPTGNSCPRWPTSSTWCSRREPRACGST